MKGILLRIYLSIIFQKLLIINVFRYDFASVNLIRYINYIAIRNFSIANIRRTNFLAVWETATW